jgi:hypothetical protein
MVQCGHCNSAHHADCWDDNRGCAVVACAGGPTSATAAQPTAPQNPLPPAPSLDRREISTGDLGGGGAPATPPAPPPRAGELTAQLLSGLQTPSVVFALVSAAIGAAVTLGAALVVAVAFPDEGSLIGLLGFEASMVTETCRDAIAFLQAGFSPKEAEGGFTIGSPMPLLFVAFPLAGCALGAVTQSARTAGLRPAQRLLWGALVGVPFAVLMLLVGLGTGDEIDPKSGAVFGLALLWGAAGGTLGAWWSMRRQGEGIEAPPSGPVIRAVGASARSLGALLVVMSVLGAGTWIVQTFRNVPAAKFEDSELNPTGERSKFAGSVENALFALDHGVRFAELGAGVEFVRGGGEGEEFTAAWPLPVSQARKIGGDDEFEEFDYEFRVFSYSDPLKPWMFVPLLIILLGTCAFFALFAGFSTARAVPATTPAAAAVWGGSVGVVWGLLMVAAEALARTLSFFEPHGRASGDSVFVMFLLGGAVLGAVGGYLALVGAGRQAAGAPPGNAVQ